jgi:hypothetical protein
VVDAKPDHQAVLPPWADEIFSENPKDYDDVMVMQIATAGVAAVGDHTGSFSVLVFLGYPRTGHKQSLSAECPSVRKTLEAAGRTHDSEAWRPT